MYKYEIRILKVEMDVFFFTTLQKFLIFLKSQQRRQVLYIKDRVIKRIQHFDDLFLKSARVCTWIIK